jgi:adenylosuccinate lyase
MKIRMYIGDEPQPSETTDNNSNVRNISEMEEMDRKIQAMEKMICEKEKMLEGKQKTFEQTVSQNQFLEMVKKDYQKYYAYIHQKKQEQLQALETLHAYVEKIRAMGELSEHNLEDAKFEQRKIHCEIQKIRKKIAKITQLTQTA